VDALTEIALHDNRARSNFGALDTAWILRWIGGKKAIGSLVSLMRGDAPSCVREEAARGLGWLETELATDALIERIRSDDSASVRKEALRALGRISSRTGRFVQPLVLGGSLPKAAGTDP
jgi:HEAT repeat protein